MNRTKMQAWQTNGLAMVIALSATVAHAQKITAGPAVDSSVLSSPTKGTTKAPVQDASFQASPEIGPAPKHEATIAPGTEIHATLLRAVDSGKAKNDDSIPAKLSAPVRTSDGTLPAGTPVMLNVIGSLPAGELSAMGELSLQAVRVGHVDVFSDIKTYRGEPGKREVADAAPQLGTNAGLAAGAEIDFRVPKPPAPADAPPNPDTNAPGSVNGVAQGSEGTPLKGNSGEPTYGDTKSVLPESGITSPTSGATNHGSTTAH